MSERQGEYLDDAAPVVPPVAVREWLDKYDVARCYYCGEPAGSIDHVVPRSMLETLRIIGDDAVSAILARHGRRMTVPCCMECNGLLSNKYFSTLEQRKAHLKERLRQRHQAVLRTPDWTDRELSQLGDRMQEYVIAAIVKRDIVLRRLRY